MEDEMKSRILSGAAAAALAGFALAVLSATPSSAFTLSGQGLDKPVAAADVDHVWYDRWGRWHPDCWVDSWGRRRCGDGPGPGPVMVPMPGPWMAPGPHCRWDAWGHRHCGW